MTSLADDEDGIPKMIDAPCMFEDGGIHKANGKILLHLLLQLLWRSFRYPRISRIRNHLLHGK